MDMNMILHFGEREMILFSFWKTGSLTGMAVSMLITFLMCIVYEAIKSFRYFLAVYHSKQRIQGRQNSGGTSNSVNSGADAVSEDSIQVAPLIQLSGFTRKLFTPYRISQAALYGLQAVLAYALMLIVMTFNVNLILAVVFGEAVGYFLFTGTPLVDNAVADCC
ncbi:unnamed protein product [Caenorhabditis auriculariae]|uniref:Copper transport protein n=1 Tax=Caenorhabditis auriculariae TaxID=2777116 RepID=A0A8S1HFW3_9PELO|nr:unnamed protein product [Caenorhabditis auriculariae]